MVEQETLQKIVGYALDKKAIDIKVLDLTKVTTLTDYFIICSAEADTQVKAIYEHIESELKNEGVRVWHKEGHQNLQWVLLDYVDFVVHIFMPEVREFYGLERLWGDAREIKFNFKELNPVMSE